MEGAKWREVLAHVSDGVIVMDGERQLQFANNRARKLLGFSEGETVSGRCRLNTNGVDCEIACPLTFAIEQGRTEVRDFETVYHASDGSAVPLRVTVLPLFDSDGTFSGAIEILRERGVDQGFFLAGKGSESEGLKSRLAQIAVGATDVILVGERSARQDVARTLHRLTGLDDDQFLVWPVSEDECLAVPPGICFADDGQASSLWQRDLPSGWRRFFGVSDTNGLRPSSDLEVSIVQLPSPEVLQAELPLQLAAWVRQYREDLEISPEALGRLGEIALDRGLDGVAEILPAAVAAADRRLELSDLPQPSSQTLFIDHVLETDDPLGTLERRLLTEVLERCEWRMQEAADRLGMSRVTLWRKTRDYGIERPSG
ncbi:MAG: helix-turn-helix domain-containing protein [Acidobacteriota bacterium]